MQNFQSSLAAREYWKGVVDVERIQLAITEAVDRCAHALHQYRQLGLVVRRHGRASHLAI
jgi:hypothetical protein